MAIQPKILNQNNNGYGYKQSIHYWEHCLKMLSEINDYYDKGGYDYVIERGSSRANASKFY